MKKMTLKFGSVKEMLTKEQMQIISGGYVCYGLGPNGQPTGSGTIDAANCCDAQAIADHDAWGPMSASFPYGIDCPCDMDCN